MKTGHVLFVGNFLALALCLFEPRWTEAQQTPAAPAQPSATATTGAGQAAQLALQATDEERADALLARRQYKAAIGVYQKIPDKSWETWNKLGVAYHMMFLFDQAESSYLRALKLQPKEPRIYNNLGTVYDSMKRYKAGERMYRKAIKLDTKSALAHKNLGTNLLSQHKYKKGWQEYQTAISLDPEIFRNRNSPHIDNSASVEERGAMNYYMAKSCVRAGLHERAVEYLRNAVNEGFTNTKKIAADQEFAVLKGLPAFERMLDALDPERLARARTADGTTETQ